MGNKVPETQTHNPLDNNILNKVKSEVLDDNQLNSDVNLVVQNLIDSVLIHESIMSEERNEVMPTSEIKRDEPLRLTPKPDENEEYAEIDECFNIAIQCCTNVFESPNVANSPDSSSFETAYTTDDENELLNENEYLPPRTSPVSGSSYTRLNRVSPTPATTSLSDWKYSSNGYSSKDNEIKLDNNVLDTWGQKEPIKRNSSKSGLSRFSLYRQFDPLVGNEDNQYSKMLKTSPRKSSDGSDLIEKFDWLRINDSAESPRSPKSPKSPNSGNYNGLYINSPKPDVLAFATEDSNENNMKEQYQKYDEKLKEKDILISELRDKVNVSENKNTSLMKLIETMHNINEELVQAASEELQKRDAEISQLNSKCDSLSSEKCQAFDDVNGIEKSFSDLHLRYDKLRNDYTLKKEDAVLYKQQYHSAMDRVHDLENICKDLKTKVDANTKLSGNEKKEVENELIAVKALYKKAEMKINSLQSQLDQKTQENGELSTMVDDLIVQVRK